MATNDRCPRCGAMILPHENFCPQCGAPLKAADVPEVIPVAEYDGPAGHNSASEYASPQEIAGEWTGGEGQAYTAPADTVGWQPGTQPLTIEGLRAFCDYNGMPLEKMRFFVGVDYRQPRAFGIYREGDQFIVYKNKADGSRAVRYHGPDEAHAVGELYAKLLDECHKRNIWPDGKPEGYDKAQKKAKRRMLLIVAIVMIISIAAALFIIQAERREHAHDGYYRFDDAGLYYRYGNDWYYDNAYYDWVLINDVPYYEDYGDYYYGDAYDSNWGYSDFERSETWENIQEENRTRSEDYSGWNSNDTNWSSDW